MMTHSVFLLKDKFRFHHKGIVFERRRFQIDLRRHSAICWRYFTLTVGGKFQADEPPNERPAGAFLGGSLRSSLNISDKHGVSLSHSVRGGQGPTRPERTVTRHTIVICVCAEGGTSGEKVHRHYQKSNGQMLAERLLPRAHRLPEPPTADERIRVERDYKVRPVFRSHVGTTSICEPVLQTSVFGCCCSSGESQTHTPWQSYPGR